MLNISARRFLSAEELSTFLINNLLYRQEGIYAFSKPLGVLCNELFARGPFEDVGVGGKDEVESGELTINSVLPSVASHFGESELVLVKSLPKYVSGPIIATVTQEKVVRRVRGSMYSRAADAGSSPGYLKAVALCVGRTSQLIGGEKFVAKSINVRGYEQFDVCFEKEVSKRQFKQGLVTSDRIDYRVLGDSCDVSLVELSFSKFAKDIPRLFLMHKGMPILGDSHYQQRVARILGRTVHVLPQNASPQNQYMPLELLKRLKISPKQYLQLPFFLHILGVHMKRLHAKKKEDVFICDPLPSHFNDVLKRLDLVDCIEEKADSKISM